MKRAIKKNKLNNERSECHNRIYDTYPLYKYSIGIDYHHIMNRDGHTKKNKLNNEGSECHTRFTTLTHYTSTL